MCDPFVGEYRLLEVWKRRKPFSGLFVSIFRELKLGSGSGFVSLNCCGQGGFYMSMIFTGEKTFRSVKTAGHSRFWQSGRSFHRSIRQCQLLDFVSGQSECPVGDAKQPQQMRSMPKDRRTQAVSILQPFPTAVFAAVSPDGEIHSLCGADTKQAIS